MRLLLGVFLGILLCVLITAKPFQDGQDNKASSVDAQKREQAVDLLRRITREAGVAKPACKYQKGPWSACDPQTKKRSRTFSLKKGSKSECEEYKVLTKDCKAKRQKQKGETPKNRERKRQNKKGDKARTKQQQQE